MKIARHSCFLYRVRWGGKAGESKAPVADGVRKAGEIGGMSTESKTQENETTLKIGAQF